MRIKINNFEDIVKYSGYVPVEALNDVNRRITDWIASGGKQDDPYIKQQFRYIENIVNMSLEGMHNDK